MKFALSKDGCVPIRDEMVEELIHFLRSQGHQLSADTNGIKFLLNLTSMESPRAGRRRSQSVFIISVVATDKHIDDMRSACYRTLIRTLSNLLICFETNGNPVPEVYFTTPEAGFYHVPFDPEEVYRLMLPIAGAHYAIENRLIPDLPPRFKAMSPVVHSIARYGKELDKLGVLPTPFPLRELLSEDDMRHLYKIYGITGLSYGNLSARENIPELGQNTFWMTGRGIDKANISRVGKDVLLVKGFDYERGEALVSVPEDFDPTARVSVDAVEHELIYRTFPDVAAIVHVHAWMENIVCTRQNYPCGTRELAREVVDLLRCAENPARAVSGLKNHGLTITGPSLDEIFDRIRGKLLTEVPMFG